MRQTSKRNPIVEFLRCALMFLIVLRHCYHCGMFRSETGAWTLLYGPLIGFHTDAFLAISGWYGINFTWRKFSNLLCVVLFYSAVSFVCSCSVEQGGGGFYVNGGWITTYLMLMLMAPMLNCAVEWLLTKPLGDRLKIWLPFAVGVTLAWGAGNWRFMDCPNGWGASCVTMFVWVYFTSRLASCSFGRMFANKKVILLALAVFLLGILVCGGAALLWQYVKGLLMVPKSLGAFSYYDAPHVWLFAVALVGFFATRTDFRLSEPIARFVRLISPSMLGVYLIHATTVFGPSLYLLPQKWMTDNLAIHPFWNVLISAVVCFAVCCLLDSVRRLVVVVFSKKVDGFYGRVDD